MTEKDKPEIVVNRGLSRRVEDDVTNHLQEEDDPITGDMGEEDDEIIAFPAFGARRLKGQELMIEFRLRDGTTEALAYTYLVKADFCPKKGINLAFVGHKVSIEGRNLLILFKFLVRHAVNFVSEKDEHYDTGDKEETFVSGIEITSNE